MSLIDEALKRARDQKPPQPGPAGPRSRRTPDPWAYAPLPHARRRSGVRARVVAGSIGAIAAVAVAGIWLSRSGGSPARRPTPTRSTAGAAGFAVEKPSRSSLPAAAPSPPAALPSSNAGSPEAAAAKPRKERPAPARAPVSRPDGGVPGAAPGKAEAAPAPQALPHPANRAFDGRTYVGALVAPNGSRVELGGIVYSETNASALLNGRILPVGGVVEGLTISSIEEDRVELTGDGITVHLTLR
jgi:hypothetical protein